MIKIGSLYFPDGEKHFVAFGEDVVNYQRPQRDQAFKYVTSWDRAIDVGAHVGIFSRHFAEKFHEVWAFEPIPETRECLTLNVPSNVVTYPFALGEKPGVRNMYSFAKNSGGSFIYDDADVPIPPVQPASGRQWEVNVRTLDELGVQSLGLIKLDVQGSECTVLRGAQKTLQRFRPVVLIEEKPLGGPGRDTSHIAQAAEILKSFGMSPKEKVGADRIYIFD